MLLLVSVHRAECECEVAIVPCLRKWLGRFRLFAIVWLIFLT